MNNNFQATNEIYPLTRLRRNRKSEWSRSLLRENSLCTKDLILPLFVIDGNNVSEPITSMPGVSRLSIDLLLKKIEEAVEMGIVAVALFPVIDVSLKDEDGSESINVNSLVNRAVREIKKRFPDIGVICDVALDPYTIHGHDGIVRNNSVNNDLTIAALASQALNLASAGADIVAPSDMMDGRVLAVRNILEQHEYHNVQILSYAAKYCSSLYGPFREAVGSSANLGVSNKKDYQMDFSNSREAIREVMLDINEGADMIMVKPGIAYLDIIKEIKDSFNIPVFAYQVSGEYSMIKFAAQNGAINEMDSFYEMGMAFKRAGCSAFFTYAAIDLARFISNLST